MRSNPPVPGKFDQDPRVHIDKASGRYHYEDEDHAEFEWNGRAWLPVIDEDSFKAQQAAYAVAGVDENTPAAPVLAREERLKKRKADAEAGAALTGVAAVAAGRDNNKASKVTGPNTKPPAPQSAPKKTAVFVSNLPPTATPQLLAAVFSKAGVLLVNDDGEPRVKMYHDADGKFKGEALIMYFKEGSVDLAITLLDDTELELGAGYGNMRVRVAEYDKSAKKEGGGGSGGAGGAGGAGAGGATAAGAAAGGDGAAAAAEKTERKKYSAEEKHRMSKRMRTLESKLAWDSGDDSDTPGPSVPPPNRFNRVVVLKGMFAPEDLEKEPELLLELKDDVRDEAESLGTVTSVVLYDKEEDGVMTVKFKDPIAAEACVLKMNGRFFDKRRIEAAIYTGRERYRKSGGGDVGDDGEEKQRLDNFAEWLAAEE